MSDIFGIGGAVQAGATVASAALQAGAIDNATNAQRDAFNTITANNKPFLTTGTQALQQLGASYGLGGSGAIDPNAGFYQSPDYQFRMSQGIKGVDAGAAARGMLDSGATRKAEIGYAGNLASGEFNTYANRLQSLAGIGQGAASNQAAAAQGYANNIGNLAAAGANNWGNAINGVAGMFGNKSPYGSSYGGGGWIGTDQYGGAGGIGGILPGQYSGNGNGEW